jgi:hypothetical protein
MNTSTASVDRAKRVLEKCIHAIQRAVRVGDVAVSDAAAVARLSQTNQRKALAALKRGWVKTLAEWAKRHAQKKAQSKPGPKPAAKQELLDKAGRPVPDACRDAFADPALAELVGELEAAEATVAAEGWAKRAAKLADHYPFLLLERFHQHAYDALRSLQLALEALRAGVPYAVCPACDGRKDGCRTCRGRGHIPEHRHQELAREPGGAA